MLTSIALHNFKSFVDVRATISSFTLLIGANGSGKSNFLDALRLLHGLSHGWTTRDVATGKTEGATTLWEGIRGGTRELVRLGSQAAEIHTEWKVLGDHYTHSIKTDGASILSESIYNLVQSHRDPVSGELEVRELAGSVPGAILERLPANAERSVASMAQVMFVAPFRSTLGSMRFVEPVTSEMRSYTELPKVSTPVNLSSTGKNLSGILWQLCQQDQYREEITDWLTEFCGPEIQGLDFDITESGDVLLRVLDSAGAKVTARSMSDGTLRFLFLLSQLKTLGKGIQLVFEDLEHGFHPKRCRLLIDAIASTTTPDLPAGNAPQVIATTHSADVIEAALRIPHATVLLFARDPLSHGTVIRDVRALPQFDEVCKRRDFGYLLNTGWLERAV